MKIEIRAAQEGLLLADFIVNSPAGFADSRPTQFMREHHSCDHRKAGFGPERRTLYAH
jgi:hypothetical protein